MPRRFEHSEFADMDFSQVAVVVPARECAETIEGVIASLEDFGQVLVVDAGSSDGTAEIAALAGAEVCDENHLLRDFGPVRGKGDAMWRALSLVRHDIVVYVDGDTTEFGPHFARGLAGPLLAHGHLHFVKGAYRRPFVQDGTVVEDGGGRVTELMARPLLRAFYPELAGFQQPLAGEFAGRRELFERIPWATGYAAEISLLIDVWKEVGTEGMAQVDIGERRQPHQPLHALGRMADTILAAVCERLHREGRIDEVPPHDIVERPPLVQCR